MNDFFNNFSIAAISTASAKTLSAPFELWRIQRQNHFIPNSTIRDVVKKEGIRYLWKGNITNVVKGVPQYSINYALFRIIDDKIENKFVSGICSGALSIGSIYPLETTRTYLSLQTNKNKYRGIYDCLKRTPIRNLYQGFSMSLIGFGSFTGWLFYLQSKLNENYPDLAPINGGLASMGALSFSYPTDLMRRRLQLQKFDKSVPIYRNNIDVIKKIKQNEGIRGFYKGIHANLVKSFVQWSIHFYILETLNKLIKK